MSAPNFYYKNRCIIVTNDDYECNNMPCVDSSTRVKGGSSYYTSVLLQIDPWLKEGEYAPAYWQIVATAGYYGDGCLDFIENPETTVADCIPDCECTREELVGYLQDFDPSLSKWRILQLMGKRGKTDYYEWLKGFIARADSYIKEQERILCNAILDRIKEEYGYREVVCTGVMSNGEAVYAPVENPINLRRRVAR